MLDESLYSNLVATVFKKIVAAADQLDPDLVECDSTGDMVTFTAPKTAQKVVINTQRAVRQIWVAGKSQGIHFSYDGTKWLDDKNKGIELYAWISECVDAMSGAALTFG